MDSSSLRPEFHVAQQSRRDKLRIQPTSASFHLIDNLHNNFETTLNPDLVHVRNGEDHVFYDPITTVFSSPMLNFASSFTSMSNPFSSNFTSTPKISSNDNWRSVESSHRNYEWTMNYASGSSSFSSGGRQSNVVSNNARVSSISTSIQYAHELESLNQMPGQTHQDHDRKHLRPDEIQFSYNNHMNSSLQDLVTPTSLYLDSSHQWSNEFSLITRKNEELTSNSCRFGSDPHARALSLSLSSNPPYSIYESDHLQSKLVKADYLCPKVSTKPLNKSPNEIGTSNYAVPNVGPFGPFTGYATILKSSKFLKPAQDLLDEFCNSTGSKLIPARICGDHVNSSLLSVEAAPDGGAKGNNNDCGIISGATFYGSKGAIGDVGMTSSFGESYRTEYQQKKAKLVYLQEEVCRKHRQYHQQMQMVASSFETVAGLSAATPYVSLALKSVSRNFRDLKHAISDQLKQATRALGEDLLSPNVGGTSTSKTRSMDHSPQTRANSSFFEPHQHIWRPQRGLPERSVAILKAWLYEHFLHPYPSDTDKHMLANQTGLSRNQVSNWFINARVRVWKPMVEEIHMLETKGMSETNKSCGNNGGKSAECSSQPNCEQTMNNVGSCSMMNKQLECSGSAAGSGEQIMNSEQWNQEKRPRMEYGVPSSMDGSVMNFAPYQRSGIDIGPIGAVSLTLGLRHSVENVQQQQQTQLQPLHEDQIRRHFGGQMVHDFVG